MYITGAYTAPRDASEKAAGGTDERKAMKEGKVERGVRDVANHFPTCSLLHSLSPSPSPASPLPLPLPPAMRLLLIAALAAAAHASSVLDELLRPHKAAAFLSGSGEYNTRMLAVHRNDSDYFAEMRDALADSDRVVAAFRSAGTIGRAIKVRREEEEARKREREKGASWRSDSLKGRE